MREFDFFSFMWRPYRVVFDSTNIRPALSSDDSVFVLTDDSGQIILTPDQTGSFGDRYRYV